MMDEFFFDDTFRKELENEAHHYGEVVFLESSLEKGMNVIEVGGHSGVTAVAIAHTVGESGHVYVSEPVPEYFRMLEKNIENNNLSNVTLSQKAVGIGNRKIDFFKHGGGSGITEAENADRIVVELTTLADFRKEHTIKGPVDYINMDCEGSELNVLKSGEDIITTDHPVIFSEVHPGYLGQLGQTVEELVDLLEGFDYQVKPVQVEALDEKTGFEECSHIFAWFE